MSWDANINQYVGWNVKNDSLVVDLELGMQGCRWQDRGYTLVLSGNSACDYVPSDTYPAIKRNDIIFSDLDSAEEYVNARPTGYFYNGFPVFIGGTFSQDIFFKSRANEWIYIPRDYAEPTFHIDTSKEIFLSGVSNGSDLRELSAATLDQYDLYRLTGDTLDDKVAADGQVVDFTKWDDSEDGVEISCRNPIWRKDIISNRKFIVTPANQKYMERLSSFIGVYRCAGEDPRVFGTGKWGDDHQYFREDLAQRTASHVYLVRVVNGQYGLLGTVDSDGYVFDGIYAGFSSKPTIHDVSIVLDGNTTFRATDGHTDVLFTVPFAGWDLGTRDPTLYHSQHPWYR